MVGAAPFAAPSDFDAAFERKLRFSPNGASLNQQVERPTEGGQGGICSPFLSTLGLSKG